MKWILYIFCATFRSKVQLAIQYSFHYFCSPFIIIYECINNNELTAADVEIMKPMNKNHDCVDQIYYIPVEDCDALVQAWRKTFTQLIPNITDKKWQQYVLITIKHIHFCGWNPGARILSLNKERQSLYDF